MSLSFPRIQCRFQPRAEFNIFRPTGDAGFGRHQDLEVGGVKVAQSAQIRLGARPLLEPVEQPFRLLHAHLVAKYGAIPLKFNGHQTISRTLRIMSTEPSPIRARSEEHTSELQSL